MQRIKKTRDPRWEEEFEFMLDSPPENEKMQVEVISLSNRMGLRSKVHKNYYYMLLVMQEKSKMMNFLCVFSGNTGSCGVKFS